jgi:hypothetical protein
LIAVNDTLVPQKVVELDITGLTASSTNMFDLQANRSAIGNPLYTLDGKLILINQDTISSDYYLSQYNYSTGILEVDFNIGSFAATAIAYCDCIIYLISNIGGASMVVNTYPGYELVTLLPATGLSVNLSTQLASCVVNSLTENPLMTTTTSTTVMTYCYTVDVSGEGTLSWLDGFGQLQFLEYTEPQTITLCAQYNSISSDGDLVFNLCTDYFSCTTEGDCPTTTTTTTTP